ncbi:malonic semialdehyde reductase [Duganella sp. BJB488]|uniref:malonic semialdehyde reductase n=1 Tax=unclassified Duganella TaxID=2636909 RepID=UPI000E340DE9|nr:MULTISPECIES: malonic semialdehyde reductase [unclassified Duganella]RFP09293.1 malonic semialdehyde reductase [Duganella sp. BJB475]RFP13182.1 malonic semialdehyde reductase [Duganella sp. BJB489]RFP17058.1 malonic semialdehyde reductase [Duganella sp. BJB488]RFP25329.1 malonic semialdehyde reductase [Duganella sp. BJB476]RFP31536.1 malonic semialdehyde reductase [Duganella sp. BJB480]
MTRCICDDAVRDLIFREARSQNRWQARGVDDALLREVYELLKWGPTSMNTSPLRLLFLRTPEAKERLLPALAPGNVDKARTAPVVAVVAYDRTFYEKLPTLFPHRADAADMFRNNERLSESTAFRNASLQGAYLMIAARMVGLDCGPMSGFNEELVNQTFFSDGAWKVNFLCGIGYGDATGLFPRHPKLSFEEVCQFR